MGLLIFGMYLERANEMKKKKKQQLNKNTSKQWMWKMQRKSNRWMILGQQIVEFLVQDNPLF